MEWHGRSHDAVMRWANSGFVGRSEILVTRLLAESSQLPACPSKTTAAERKPFWWHRLAVSWEVVLHRGCRRAWVLCGWTEAGSNAKIPGLKDHVLPVGYPDVGRSVVADPLKESVRVPPGLEQLLPGRLRRIHGQLIALCLRLRSHKRRHDHRRSRTSCSRMGCV